MPTIRPAGVRWPARAVPAIRSTPPGLVAAISAGPALCPVRPIAAAAFAGAAAAPVGVCAVRVAASALAARTALITALASGIPVTARSTATRGTFSAVTGAAVPSRRSAVSAGGAAAG